PREPERPTPGSTERDLSPQLLARLPIDASDLTLIATLAPGVVGIAGTDSTDAAFSVAGQRTTANDITLDGLSFGSGAVPQDAVQGRWRAQGLTSLATADPSTLARLGVSPDSVARFIGLAQQAGTPITMPGLPDDRATDNTVGLVRFDWNISDVQTLMLRLDG